MKQLIITILLWIQVRVFRILILRESKWRCGGIEEVGNIYPSRRFSRGYGSTQLENSKNYRCCLGQFTKQILPSVSIRGLNRPSDVSKYIPYLNESHIDPTCFVHMNTYLSREAMYINDSKLLSIEDKVIELRKLFWKEAKLIIIYI